LCIWLQCSPLSEQQSIWQGGERRRSTLLDLLPEETSGLCLISGNLRRSQTLLVTETHPQDPLDIYGETKVAMSPWSLRPVQLFSAWHRFIPEVLGHLTVALHSGNR
jgi:hypothetical protein